MTESNPNFLNVDDVLPAVAKTISIKGEIYEYQPPNVEDFLKEMQRLKEVKDSNKGEGLDEIESMTFVVESLKTSILQSFPTMDEAVLKSLTLEQLRAIRDFISAEIEKDVETAEDEAGNA